MYVYSYVKHVLNDYEYQKWGMYDGVYHRLWTKAERAQIFLSAEVEPGYYRITILPRITPPRDARPSLSL